MALGQPQLGRRPVPSRIAGLWVWVALAVIELGAGAARLWGLGRYHGLIYDEYYYVPAADTLLGRKSPVHLGHAVPGIDPNLLSHPPFAKELIAGAILLFGNHPWAWRLPSAVFGLMVPPLLYLLAAAIFRSRLAGLVAASAGAVDGLLISLSRVALPDGVAVPLVALNAWLLWILSERAHQGRTVSRSALFGWGVLLGLGFSAKWIGAQTILMAWIWLGVCWRDVRRSRPGWWLAAVTVIPLAAYFSTYAYAFPSGFHQSWLPANPVVAFFVLQWMMLKNMWTLRFFHPWTSNAYSWLGLPRPTAFLILYGHNTVSRLFAVSDPLLVWAGVASLLGWGVWAWRTRREVRVAIFLALWLAMFYGTWLATPRSKFTYYFASAEMGLILAFAGVLARQLRSPASWRRWGAGGMAAAVALSDAYLMPLFTATPMPAAFYNALWPPSWNPRQRTPAPSAPASATLHPLRISVADWLLPAAPAGTGGPAALTSGRNAWYQGTGRSGFALRFPGSVQGRVAVGNGLAVFGTTAGQVDAVWLNTGQVAWSEGVPNQVWGAPALTGSLAVVGLGNPGFRTLSTQNGWERGQGTSGLMAFNLTTGREQWFFSTRGEDMASPTVAGGYVFETTGDGRLVAVKAATGHLAWSLPIGGFDSRSSVLVVGSTVYVATNRYRASFPAAQSWVTAVNWQTRQIVWQRALPVVSGLSDASLAENGQWLMIPGVTRVQAGDRLTVGLFALSQTTGQVAWQRSLGTGTMALAHTEVTSPLVAGGDIYLADPATRTIAAWSLHGTRKWTRKLPGRVFGTPVWAGGYLLVGDSSGQMTWLDAATGGSVSAVHPGLGGISAHLVLAGTRILGGTVNGWFFAQPLVFGRSG